MIPTLAPTWKQHLAWEKLNDSITEFVLFGGGAGGGKSWLGGEFILSSAIRYPGTSYFIGRSELKQLRKSTIPTIYKICRHYKINPDSIFKYNNQDQTLYFHNGSRVDLIELKYYPSDPLYERWGSLEYTQGWCEEVGETESDAINMISSRTGRQLNDQYGLLGKVLMTCNPKKNWLYYQYYLPAKEGKLPENKAFIKALVTDNQYGESGYKKKLEGFKGITLQRLRYGVWEYAADATALIDTLAIPRLFEFPRLTEGRKKRITVDVARFGGDSTVIALWEGNHAKLFRYVGLSVTQTAAKIRALAKEHGIPSHRIIVDADGVGGGVVDILSCRQFINNASPFPAPIKPAIDPNTGEKIPEQYTNLKSQCSFRVADRINNGLMTVEIMPTYLELENNEHSRLVEDLEQVKRKDIDSDGKLAVISKKDVRAIIGRSTDYWDALMMDELFNLDPEPEYFAF